MSRGKDFMEELGLFMDSWTSREEERENKPVFMTLSRREACYLALCATITSNTFRIAQTESKDPRWPEEIGGKLDDIREALTSTEDEFFEKMCGAVRVQIFGHER